MIKAVFSIISILLLASCASPERMKSHYNNLGSGCVSIGKSMGDVEQCIGIEFRESTYQNQIVRDHQSCKPYWGFPFIQSCGGIKVIYDQNKVVTKWFAWGQFDGV